MPFNLFDSRFVCCLPVHRQRFAPFKWWACTFCSWHKAFDRVKVSCVLRCGCTCRYGGYGCLWMCISIKPLATDWMDLFLFIFFALAFFAWKWTERLFERRAHTHTHTTCRFRRRSNWNSKRAKLGVFVLELRISALYLPYCLFG